MSLETIILTFVFFIIVCLVMTLYYKIKSCEEHILIMSTMIKDYERRNLFNSFTMLSFVFEYAKEHEMYEYCRILKTEMENIQKQIIEHDLKQ